MMPSHSSSSGRTDHCVATLLNIQRDAGSLNPALIAAILNGGRSFSNVSAHVSAFQNKFLRSSSVLSGGLNTDPAFLASLSFNAIPFDALSLSRVQQQRSTPSAVNCFNFPSISARRSGGVPESRNLALLQAVQSESRNLEVLNAVQREATISEAYQRDREEAILCLFRSKSVEPASLHVQPVPTSVGVIKGTVADLVSPKDSNTRALETLGNDARRKANAPYFDASSLEDPDEATLSSRRTRGGVTEPFPEKLYRMLRETAEIGKSDVISFYPHGRAFGIHHAERFCREIMPNYFRQSRLSSFQRQLNLYGFQRISSGPDCGGYYHELFLKGRPALSIHMRRVGIPQGDTKVGARVSTTSLPVGASPDFYSMIPVKEGNASKSGKV